MRITSEGAEDFNFVFNSDEGGFSSKLSKSQRKKVEAMWKELRPACVLYVDHYFYFIEMLEGSPTVVARAQECSLPHMDEKAVTLIEMMKAKCYEVERMWKMEEDERAAEKERRKQEKAAAKEEELQLKREAVARRQEARSEQFQGEIFALKCLQGNTAYSAGDWTR